MHIASYIMILSTLTHAGQHCDQQPVERDRSPEGSRGRASQQHSSQVERRGERTVNGI